MSAPSSSSTGRRVILLGGTSEIGLACVRALQREAPREVVLVGRDPDALKGAGEGLRAAGVARVIELELDALALERHAQVVDQAFDELGGGDIVILAVGVLGARGGLPDDIAAALEVLQVNAVGAGSLLMHAARRLREQGSGALVVLSSVAAERPRRANAVYGASKAALDSLAQSIGDDLFERGVRILVVRPGFVRTRMTDGLDPAPMSITPEAVADAVRDGLAGGSHTVWVPRVLRAPMLLTKMLPRPIFRKIKQ